MFLIDLIKSVIFGLIYYTLYWFIDLTHKLDHLTGHIVLSRNFLLNIIGAILFIPVKLLVLISKVLSPLLHIFQ
jgi:hypothetical protein